ncbi:hypothetical protein B0T20DRAFT_451996 [Sordaria brevicollis]|uniref:Zn(2)-C6 fungal-type domain-containing protein n=1 Tax=Sordaria brevicollis TaxID=83679 RepID=A0AAE0PGZ4_SORBR|nr:hypothetical protein B0T20DRAFT_451996 [Sordaria brevicollis]
MDTSAHQGLAMSGVIQDKQSLNLEAAAKGHAANADTGKHPDMASTQRGPVASIFRPHPNISKANTGKPPAHHGSVKSLSSLGITGSTPMEAATVRLFNFLVTSGDFQRLLMAPSGSATIEDMLASVGCKTFGPTNSASGAGATDNDNGDGNDNGGNSGDGAASSANHTTAADTSSATNTNTGTPRRRRAAGGGGGGGTPRKPGGTPRKKPISRADIEKRGSCERCKKSKAKCEPHFECIRCAKNGKECSLKETMAQDTGRRVGACQSCRKAKIACKKVEACIRCHKAEQTCSWATEA